MSRTLILITPSTHSQALYITLTNHGRLLGQLYGTVWLALYSERVQLPCDTVQVAEKKSVSYSVVKRRDLDNGMGIGNH